MRCYKCQKEIADNSLVCSWCGAEMSDMARRRNNFGMGGFSPNGAGQMLPMNWYKFLVTFVLFFDAVQYIFSGVSYITGYISRIPLGEEGYVIYSFSLLGEGFKWVDVLYGLLCFALAVFAVYTRFRLAKFKKNAHWLYLAYLTVTGLASVGYGAVFYITAGADASTVIETVIQFVPQALIIYLNYIYFEKRKHLFRG